VSEAAVVATPVADAAPVEPVVTAEATPAPVKSVLSTVEAAAEGKPGDAAVPAEIQYDLKAPEGVALDPAVMGTFVEFAKAEKLPNDLAQKLVEFGVKWQSTSQEANRKAFNDNLALQNVAALDEIQKDSDLGGAKFDETRRLAAQGFQKFATPEDLKAVDDLAILDPKTGKTVSIGQHPMMVRLFRKVALAFREETAPGKGGEATKSGPLTEAELLRQAYPTMFKDKEE